jgi:hypothetical protein
MITSTLYNFATNVRLLNALHRARCYWVWGTYINDRWFEHKSDSRWTNRSWRGSDTVFKLSFECNSSLQNRLVGEDYL